MRLGSYLLSTLLCLLSFACDDGNIGVSTSVYLNIEPAEIVFDGKARVNEFLKESTFLLRTGADDLKV